MSTVPVLPSVLDGCRMLWAPITFQVGKTACVHVCACVCALPPQTVLTLVLTGGVGGVYWLNCIPFVC